MEELRDKLASYPFVTGIFCILFFYLFARLGIHPYIATILGIIVPLGICKVIDGLANKKILERIHYQQTAFNYEFKQFKDININRLTKMPFLYRPIDNVQDYIIKNCERYPNDFKNETDFKKATYKLIVGQLEEFIRVNHNMLPDQCKMTQEFVDEIKRKGKLYEYDNHI